jgi:hypothetical protein
MGSEQIPKLVGQLIRSPQQASDARDALDLTIGVDVLAPNGDASRLQNNPPGPQGPAGSGDKYFTFSQGVASDTWLINHNLGKFPSVVIIDSAETVVIGDVEYLDTNSIRVTFTSSFSGTAFLN